MTTEREPELGQTHITYRSMEIEVPDWLKAYISMIADKLDTVLSNVFQRDVPSPFGRMGPEQFVCEAFAVESYCWNEEHEQRWNFCWPKGKFEISWYKYWPCGASMNREISHEEATEMLNECLECLRRIDEAHF